MKIKVKVIPVATPNAEGEWKEVDADIFLLKRSSVRAGYEYLNTLVPENMFVAQWQKMK